MARRFNRRNKIRKNYRRSQSSLIQLKSAIKTDLSQSQNCVLNLSKHKINRYKYLALSKGLKFIPTPHKKNLRKVILNDFDEFARKLRCKYYYGKGYSRLHPFIKPPLMR